ncbi:hypothetical protein JOC85_003337 [Bacillus mesophilus]|uniref:Uncharacterized protein n=1 Tax=Bacillus mesophilus TaxID=1808955 RepID=A0A6M0Q9C4_9BACI|nr:hypothetical protein [Bacillus mesophilus]MBM7662530.1 hypothetical protein [Bacillus mesophilus]NEY72847.1 hypothetical protein [Bacillus mesophilus]
MEFIYAYDGMAKPTVGDILITDDDGVRKYYLITRHDTESFSLIDLGKSETSLLLNELPLYQIGMQLSPTSYHEIIIDIIKNRDISIDLNLHD